MPTIEHDPTPSSEALIRLLHQQQEFVDQLDRLAGRQAALIADGRCDELLDLLAQRQQVMDQFLDSQDGLARFDQRAPDLDSGSRQRIASLVESISEGLGRIVRRDEEDRRQLQTSRDRTGSQLASLRTARRAQRAYVSGGSADPRFADRQG